MAKESNTAVEIDLQHQLAARVGRVLSQRYTLEALLGVGGMASVYRARHRNGNRVAVKILHPQVAFAPDLVERFVREGYVANRVDHAGAVRVLDDAVTDDGEVYLVMELLEGETLEERIVHRGGKIASVELVPIAIDILDVLGAAHAKGIIHRDIKPENVFLEESGVVKILDFGIARVLDGSVMQTRTGRILGTPAYMAPEQARGESRLVDSRTDTWAVGATCFRGLLGAHVHEGETPALTVIASATKPARPVRQVDPSIDRHLAEIIDRALMMSMASRWPSAKAMATALRSLSTDELLGVVSSDRDYLTAVDKTQPFREAYRPSAAPAERSPLLSTVRMPPRPSLLAGRGANLAALSYDDDLSAQERPETLTAALPLVKKLSRAPMPPPRRVTLPIVLGAIFAVLVVLDVLLAMLR